MVDWSRSPRMRGEALVDLEIPPAMGCIKAQADGIAVRRLPFRTLGSSGSNLRTPRKPPLSPRPAPQAGDAFGGSAGASSRPRDHRGKPPCPAARRRGLSDHLPMLWPTGHLGSYRPVRESGVPLRLQREPAALAGASRGLSGGSDHHQQAEEECASGHCCWGEWEFCLSFVVAPAERPFARHGVAPRIVGVQRAMVSL